MSTFSKVNFKSLNYNSFRPHYPSSFYKLLMKYVSKNDETKFPIERTIDLGCGTGVATYPLLNLSDEVIGLDLSPKMIETATSLVQKRCEELGIGDNDRVKFKIGSVEDFINQQRREIPEETVDLITAAQCIHWFKDYDSFFKSSAKLLKSGGSLAYWFYIDPVIIDFDGPSNGNKQEILAKALRIYNKYVYDDPKFLGPHWEQPGRSILKYFCEEVNQKIPLDLYEDIKIKTFIPDFSHFTPPSDDDLDLRKVNIPLTGFTDYISTYSGYHAYKDATDGQVDVIELCLKEFESELGWDRNSTKINLVWNTGYTFIRKK